MNLGAGIEHRELETIKNKSSILYVWINRLNSQIQSNNFFTHSTLFNNPHSTLSCVMDWNLNMYIYINKDENPSSKTTRHVNAKVNPWKGNQNHQNSSNEVEDTMLRGHPIPQIS